MEESRVLKASIKSRLILNKSFKVTNELSVGDKGQLLLDGIIESEKMIDTSTDEVLVKIIYVNNVSLIKPKVKRGL